MSEIEWPEAVREYENGKALERSDYDLVELADAAIAALKAELEGGRYVHKVDLALLDKATARAEKAEMNYDTAKSGWLGEVQRREQAEAEVEQYRWQRDQLLAGTAYPKVMKEKLERDWLDRLGRR